MIKGELPNFTRIIEESNPLELLIIIPLGFLVIVFFIVIFPLPWIIDRVFYNKKEGISRELAQYIWSLRDFSNMWVILSDREREQIKTFQQYFSFSLPPEPGK